MSVLLPNKKNLAYAVENTFLLQASTSLKFLMQNMYLKILCSQTEIFDLSLPSIIKNEKF